MKTTTIILFCLAISVRAADWPNFRGPNFNGFSPEIGIHTDWKAKSPKILWKTSLTDEGYACPSVADGKVFILDHLKKEDIVRALDLTTGKEVWQFVYEAGGKENYGWGRATPAFQNGFLYTINRDGIVHCLNAKTGEKVWRRDALTDVGGKPPHWEVAMSPVIDGNKLLVPGGGDKAHLIALDKKDGKILWKGGGTYKLGYATPVIATIDGTRQYLLFNAFGLVGLSPEDGKVLWETVWKTMWRINASVPIPVGPSRIYIGSGYRKGCGVYEIKDGVASKVWTNMEIPSHFNSAILHKGYLYGNGDPKYLVCLDPENGKVAWKQAGFVKGGVVAVDGHLIAVNGRNGEIAILELTHEAYREKGRIQPLEGRSWSPPIIADKKLIIRNREAIAAVDLTP